MTGRVVQAADLLFKIVEVNAGHALMTEAPDEVLFALRDFLAE